MYSRPQIIPPYHPSVEPHLSPKKGMIEILVGTVAKRKNMRSYPDQGAMNGKIYARIVIPATHCVFNK